MYRYTPILLTIIFFYGCAKIVPPSGGPVDEGPPRVIESEPANYARNFEGDEIEIEFDEFIQLQDVNNKLLISPPMKNQPKIVNKGKEIELKIIDTLRENTTYSFNFSDAIVDNNEGNPLEDFEFVFSTGPDIDSLSFEGKVFNAFDNKPVENVYAMLYDELEDSIPYKQVPYYLSRTNDEGHFSINNIRHDTFKVFMLDDKNRNYMYDMPGERIAFADTLITFRLDSTITEDTAGSGPSIKKINMVYKAPALDYYLFNEDEINQYIKTSDRLERHLLSFAFNEPLVRPLLVEPLRIDHEKDWAVREVSHRNDSITYWITDSTLIKSDTFSLRMEYTYLDKYDSLQTRADTLMMRSYTVQEDKKGQKEPSLLPVNLRTGSGSFLDLGDSVRIESEHPLGKIDTTFMRLYEKEDTLFHLVPFGIVNREDQLKRVKVDYEWEPEKTYRLDIFPNAITDIYGQTTDTLDAQIRVREESFYGNLILTLESVTGPMVIQLLDNNNSVKRKHMISSNGEVSFPYLNAATYRLKAIFDRNGNGKWDTGHYIKGIQPEKVIFYPQELQIRANWDLEQTWNLASDTTSVSSESPDSLQVPF